MNYHKLYNSIIQNAKSKHYTDYTENHHIIPKSLGGTDNNSNMVKLSAREHFLCHYILTKMYEPKTAAYYKMLKAFIMLLGVQSSNQQRYITSHKYESIRKEYARAKSIEQRGKDNSQYGTRWITNMTIDKKIKVSDALPEGWLLGQKIKYNNIEKQNNKKLNQQRKQVANNIVKQQQLQEYYDLYSIHGFDEFVKLTNYKYSQVNLVSAFKRHLPNFVPQNGKIRGESKRKSKIK